MKKVVKAWAVLILLSFICGCDRAFWAPDWDKAETERTQANLLERQTVAIEKIAVLLEKM